MSGSGNWWANSEQELGVQPRDERVNKRQKRTGNGADTIKNAWAWRLHDGKRSGEYAMNIVHQNEATQFERMHMYLLIASPHLLWGGLLLLLGLFDRSRFVRQVRNLDGLPFLLQLAMTCTEPVPCKVRHYTQMSELPPTSHKWNSSTQKG